MSLFLRKACQDLLDGVDLNNYHIQVDENTKNLQIVGECGQVLTSISGIRLSRMAPAKDEIQLALDLFDAFLAKHGSTFKEFIAVKAKADTTKEPDLPKALLNCASKSTYTNEYKAFTFTMHSRKNLENGYECEVRSNGAIKMPSLALNLHVYKDDVKQLRTCPLTEKEVTVIEKWLKDTSDFNIAVTRKGELLNKLNSCEV